MSEAAEDRWGDRGDLITVITDLIVELAPNQGLAQVLPGLRLIEDLEYHSLALLELAFTLEDEFELEPIDEEVAQGIQTIDDVVQHVLGQLESRV